jgi:hypothetical protein
MAENPSGSTFGSFKLAGGSRSAAWAVAFLLAIALAWPLRAGPPGLFVAVGDEGRRMTSKDGLVWENDQRWSGDDAGAKAGALLDIAYGAGYFMAVGEKGKTDEILMSRDGRVWEKLMGGEERLETITFGNGHFVTVQDGRLHVSAEIDPRGFQLSDALPWKGAIHARRCACGDTEAGFRYVYIGDADLEREQRHAFWRGSSETGMRWDHSMLDTPEVRDIAYGAGLFIAVGPDGRIESSHDGQTWQQRASTPGEEFSRIVWTGKRFFVTGGTTPWSSPDGIAWTKENSVIPCRVVWAREGLISFGVSWSGDFYVSSDLSEWKKIVLPPGPPLRAVTFRAGE